MSHEILKNDNLVLHKTPAWHGLGIVVEDAPTPQEALKMIGMDWDVIQEPITSKFKGEDRLIEEYVANYRSDTGTYFGLVGSKYKPIQNREVADFCEALLNEGDGSEIKKTTCESAGSIRNGAMIWFLLKGEPFNVAVNDELFPYLLVSNGHDGGTTFRVTPTFVRTVCKNTLSMVIPTSSDNGDLGSSAINIRHTVNIMERVQEAQLALKQYGKAQAESTKVIQTLSAKDVNQEAVQKFFLESYSIDFGEIPQNPTTKVEINRRERAMSAFASFSRRFDDERAIAGASAWNMLNAYSGLCQHDLKSRGADDGLRVEKRVYSNLFGLNSERTQAAFQRAFKFAVS